MGGDMHRLRFLFSLTALSISCLVRTASVAPNFYRAGYLEFGTLVRTTTVTWMMIDKTPRLVVYIQAH